MSVLIKGMSEFQRITSSKPVVFVDFFAPWCHWCQALAPFYEGVAQRVSQSPLSANVVVAKVDCTDSANLDVCRSNRIQAYPTLIAFTPTSHYKYFHYHGLRTVDAMVAFLQSLLSQADDVVTANLPLLNLTAGREGCRLKGHLTVPRMSGNFHISCHGSHASVLPSEIAVSHIVPTRVASVVGAQSDLRRRAAAVRTGAGAAADPQGNGRAEREALPRIHHKHLL